nr:hypothetical protein [Candidatus Anoxychlamydiales bacterium]
KLDYYGLEINNDYLPSLAQDVTLNYSWNKNVVANIQNNQMDTKGNMSKNGFAETINRFEQDFRTGERKAHDFISNTITGYIEGHIGKEFKGPDSIAGAYGRIFGRSAVKVQSKVSMYLGFVLVGAGIKGSGAANGCCRSQRRSSCRARRSCNYGFWRNDCYRRFIDVLWQEYKQKCR